MSKGDHGLTVGTDIRLPLYVHTTDRQRFKNCRLAWHFTSNLRLNLEPISTGKALMFGTAWHAGLEAYYDPEQPKRDIELAKAEFSRSVNRWYAGIERPSDDETDIYNESLLLGRGMLDHYGEYAAVNDRFKVIAVEKHILVPLGIEVPCSSMIHHPDRSGLCKECDDTGKRPLVYTLKLDGLVEDFNGRIWIVEHKTADKMPDNTDYLLMDDQCGSYLWGVEQELGFMPEGVLYNIAWKRTPTKLKTLKNGNLSSDKRIVTTYDYAKRQIEAHYGSVPEDFVPFLETRKGENRFFYRENIRRNAQEIHFLADRIIDEAMEMVNPSLPMYRNPNRFNCSSCAFVGPCLSWGEGGDYELMLKGNYQQRRRD